jgi:nitric oxide reductase subunit C
MPKLFLYLTLITSFFIYSGAVYTVGTEAPESQIEFSEAAKRGRSHWNANNCIACHQVFGLGGFMGPDLTNVYSTKGAAYARVILQNGTQKMPNYHFSENEIDDIIAYLAFIDSSGTSPPQKYERSWYGSLTLK